VSFLILIRLIDVSAATPFFDVSAFTRLGGDTCAFAGVRGTPTLAVPAINAPIATIVRRLSIHPPAFSFIAVEPTGGPVALRNRNVGVF
jgi:hypothetical protein